MPGYITARNAKISVFFLIPFCCLLFFLSPIQAQDVKYPDYIGYVNDFAGILDNASASDLEALITSIEKDTGAEIAVVTVDTLQGITIEEYAVELFEKWGIGKAEEDNGLLILVASTERKVRIEVGNGLEGIITDLEAGRIIDETIVPSFKEGEYSRGIYDAVVTISNQVYGEEEMALEDGSERKSTGSGSSLSAVPLTIKTEVLKAASYTSSGRKLVKRSCRYCSFHDKKTVTIPRKTRSSGSSSGGGWSGGSSGGSFGGFGGGSSRGGGASGSW